METNGNQPAGESRDKLIETFMTLMVGDPRWHWKFKPTGANPETGKVEGEYKRIRNAVYVDDVKRHIAGEKLSALSTLPHIRDRDNEFTMTRRGVVDVDDYSIKASKVEAKLDDIGLPAIITLSKSGGACVNISVAGPVPASEMRMLCGKLAAVLGLSNDTTEIFPKQAEVKDAEGWWGNGTNLPCYGDERPAYCKGKTGGFVFFMELLPAAVLTVDQFYEWLEEWKDVEPVGTSATVRHLGDVGDFDGTDKNRDNTAFALAIHCYRKRIQYATALRMAEEFALSCTPPFSTRVAKEKVERVYRNIRPDRTWEYTEADLAEFMIEEHGDDLRFDHDQSRWYHWTGTCWEPNDTQHMCRLLESCIDKMERVGEKITNDDNRKAHFAWCKRQRNITRLKSTVEYAEHHARVIMRSKDWNQVSHKLAVTNGVVNLKNGVLEQGNREDHIIGCVPFAYDPRARSALWERFMSDIMCGNMDVVRFMQRALGYSITGDVSEEVLFILSGEGSNGKSKLIEVMTHILGGNAVTILMSALMSRRSSDINNDIAMLHGKRFANASEVREGAKFDEARVKSITGRDIITARHLYSNLFSFEPTHKVWLAVNHLPNVTDTSYAFWRRIVLVRFNAQFVDKEKEPEKPGIAADKLIAEKLKADAPAVLAWLVEGARQWYAQGLCPPNDVRMATSEYQQEMDQLQSFIADDLEATNDDRDKLPASQLYEAYKQWAEGQELDTSSHLSRVKFGKEMKKRFKTDVNKRSYAVTYLGVRRRPIQSYRDT